MLAHRLRRYPNNEPTLNHRRDVTVLCLLASVLCTQVADRGSGHNTVT